MLVSCDYGLTPTDPASRLRDLWGLGTSENWGKKGTEVHLSLATRFLTPLSTGPTLSLAFLLLPMYLWRKPFLLSSTPLASFNSSWALAFLTPSLHVQPMSLYPVSAPVSVCFLFVLRLSQDHHIHPWWPSSTIFTIFIHDACSTPCTLPQTILVLWGAYPWWWKYHLAGPKAPALHFNQCWVHFPSSHGTCGHLHLSMLIFY